MKTAYRTRIRRSSRYIHKLYLAAVQRGPVYTAKSEQVVLTWLAASYLGFTKYHSAPPKHYETT